MSARDQFCAYYAALPLVSVPDSTSDHCSRLDILVSLLNSIKRLFNDPRQFIALTYTVILCLDVDSVDGLPPTLLEAYLNSLNATTRLISKSKNMNRIKAVATLCVALQHLNNEATRHPLKLLLLHPLLEVRQWTAEHLIKRFGLELELKDIDWKENDLALDAWTRLQCLDLKRRTVVQQNDKDTV